MRNTTPILFASLLGWSCIAEPGDDGPIDAASAHDGDPANLSTSPAPASASTSCDDAGCCPAGQAVQEGTSGNDRLRVRAPDTCAVGLGGQDTIVHTGQAGARTSLAGPGDDIVYAYRGTGAHDMRGGAGDDRLYGAEDDDLLAGDDGSDLLFGGAGNDLIEGGSGDDSIDGSSGDDHIVPGPGRDETHAGAGHDTVEILDLCELERGETLDGGDGRDVLVLPAAAEEVRRLGVEWTGFESVVVRKQSCRSACVAPPDCNGHGVCGEAPGSGGVQCLCDPGWGGAGCREQAIPCNEGDGPAIIDLVWSEFPDPSSGSTSPDGRVTLTAVNRGRVDRGIDVDVAAALDDERHQTRVFTGTLRAGATITVPVDLRALGADVSNLAFSGRAVAKATTRDPTTGELQQQAYSPHLYFHPQGDDLRVYRRWLKQNRYGAGDFRGTLGNARAVLEARGITVRGVGLPPNVARISEDDGGPVE